jgi:hypothetical protein
MAKHSHHKVITHHWKDGVLVSLENFFERAIDAKAFADSLNAQFVKIYDREGEIIHSAGAVEADTYA